jgi:hypothetical protein
MLITASSGVAVGLDHAILLFYRGGQLLASFTGSMMVAGRH